MHIHILGICGTFMGGIAVIAREAGHTVTGCDANVYPPMSTQLEAQGIRLLEGYDPKQLELKPDVFVIGNVVSRGNPLMEEILDRGLPYISGPQWLAENVLRGKWVLAVAGTHGKTTTAAMLAWILEDAGLRPGFLIGGVPRNFGISARLAAGPSATTPPTPLLGEERGGTSLPSPGRGRGREGGGRGEFFVIEADEYDTAFFDKRSKFVHYRPRTALLNNLEFDHADIFPDLQSIETQFHHLVRTVPGNGLIVANGRDRALARVLARGCWTPREAFGVREGWEARQLRDGGIEVLFQGAPQGVLRWDLLGEHNTLNGLAALAAARHAGVPAKEGIEALARFRNVKRRMEVRGVAGGVTVYDDFAHHPTAIETTLAGLRARVNGDRRSRTQSGTSSVRRARAAPASAVASTPGGAEPAPRSGGRIIAVLEPRSNTMKMGVWKDTLAASLARADLVFCYTANLGWDAAGALAPLGTKAGCSDDLERLVTLVVGAARPGDHVLVMSNGGFGGIHEKLLSALGGPVPPRA